MAGRRRDHAADRPNPARLPLPGFVTLGEHLRIIGILTGQRHYVIQLLGDALLKVLTLSSVLAQKMARKGAV